MSDKDNAHALTPLYSYECQVTNVVDGDTLDVEIDLGFNVALNERVRLNGVDTAEVYGVDHDSAEYQEGKEQSHAVKEWLQAGMMHTHTEYPYILYSEDFQIGKFGRVVGDIYSKHHDMWLTDFLKANYEVT